MTHARPPAKLNLALVVGPLQGDGKHEIATVLQRVDLRDDLELVTAPDRNVVVEGFPEDTLVRAALAALAEETGSEQGWHVRLEKRIPIASGLGGGSSDAAAALQLANRLLPAPLDSRALHDIAARLGSDVPFFLSDGTQLGSGDGSSLTPVALPRYYSVLLLLPDGDGKASTESVYRDFDDRRGAEGFEERRASLVEALERVETAHDLGALPRNDLASSPFAERLALLGAFRADVSGAGPAVYALFESLGESERAAAALRGAGRI